jgi:bifunctional non-homologous end joining protein LigD
MPVAWGEVKRQKIKTTDFNIKNALGRVKKKGDIFKPVLAKRQSLMQAFKKAKISRR